MVAVISVNGWVSWLPVHLPCVSLPMSSAHDSLKRLQGQVCAGSHREQASGISSFLGVAVRHPHQCLIRGQATLIVTEAERGREVPGPRHLQVPDISRGKVLAVVSEEPAQNEFQWASVGTC